MNNLEKQEPLIPASKKLPELTFKAIVIAVVLAIILAASNVYLALKIGTTISASIPASVLALGILRFFKRSNVLESNIIQTAASAGEGVAASMAFILPAMIVLHIWKGFSYLDSMLISMLGGLLGVLFSIPLRRVLLSMPTLRFPEGTAIGNVLRSSTKGGNHMKFLIQGGAVGGLVSFLQSGLQVLSQSLTFWRASTSSLFGMSIGFTPAALAAGYIIGIEVGISLLVGLIFGWVVVLPMIAHLKGVPQGVSAYDAAMSIWSHHLRFVGVGTMMLGGIWTLIRLASPVAQGLKSSFASLTKKVVDAKVKLPRTERDIPIIWVLVGTIVLSVLMYFFILHTLQSYHLLHKTWYLLFVVLCTILYIVIVGFLLATICGYFTGLIGSTNNPLSGILIIAILTLASIYILLFHHHADIAHVSAIVILVVTVVATVASIANENIQDLKAGQMVGATPWKQQLMLAVGVVVSSLIIGPVLDLLFHAYGMAGVFPHSGMDASQMLAAPQASLMAAVTKGVLTQHLQWNMITVGIVFAAIVIIVDEFLKRKGYRLPALAVGLAIYLPPEVTTPIILGGVVSYLVKRNAKKKIKNEEDREVAHNSHQRGVLLACGMVAGSALMGVILAIPFVIMGGSNALAIVTKSFAPIASVLGTIMIIALCLWFYRVARMRKV